MKMIDLPPVLDREATEAFRENLKDTEPTFRVSYLWPFMFTVSTTKYGSKSYILEFRPVQKFAISMCFFWKNI